MLLFKLLHCVFWSWNFSYHVQELGSEVASRSTCWRLGYQPWCCWGWLYLWGIGCHKRKLGTWWHAFEGIFGSHLYFLLVFTSWPPWGKPLPTKCLHCDTLFTSGSQGQVLWTETSETESQNKPFFCLSSSPEVFCHSDRKLANTLMCQTEKTLFKLCTTGLFYQVLFSLAKVLFLIVICFYFWMLIKVFLYI